MGRYNTEKKLVAEDCLRLSIHDLKRFGYLMHRTSGSIVWSRPDGQTDAIGVQVGWRKDVMYVRLHYIQVSQHKGEKQNYNYAVDLATTACNYGYYRFWFRCPLSKDGVPPCNRRVAVLYQRNGYFGCRHCHNLSYSSRNESKQFRQYPWRVMVIDDKRERLLKRMKYSYYAGKPTRLHQRIEALKLDYYYRMPEN